MTLLRYMSIAILFLGGGREEKEEGLTTKTSGLRKDMLAICEFGFSFFGGGERRKRGRLDYQDMGCRLGYVVYIL